MRPERAAPVARKIVVPEIDAPTIEAVEVISLEEVEEPGEEAAIEDEEIVDLGEDEAEIPAAGEDDTGSVREPDHGPMVMGGRKQAGFLRATATNIDTRGCHADITRMSASRHRLRASG